MARKALACGSGHLASVHRVRLPHVQATGGVLASFMGGPSQAVLRAQAENVLGGGWASALPLSTPYPRAVVPLAPGGQGSHPDPLRACDAPGPEPGTLRRSAWLPDQRRSCSQLKTGTADIRPG